MIARQVVYVVQTIRCATGSPIVGVFSSLERYKEFMELQPLVTRPHLVMVALPLDVFSTSLLEFRAPEEVPEAEGMPLPSGDAA